ncbi:NADH-quinone oxidoreductase subunit NuoN [Mycolicibacterium sp. XJ879]
MTLSPPVVEYDLVSPMLIVFGAAVAGVLIEALLPRQRRYAAQVVLSLGGLVAALVAVVLVARDMHGTVGQSAVMGAIVIDMPALFIQGTVLLVGVLGILLIAERHIPASVESERSESQSQSRTLDGFTPQASAVPGDVAEKLATRAGVIQTEVFPLTMFAIGGMLLFPASDDLLSLFVALEVLSLPLYLLCGLARRRRLLSQEAAMKYFLLGAFSSAFFIYGVAMLYGYAGTLELRGIAAVIEDGSGKTSLALIGIALLLVGVLFKIGAVPFHSWVPDVYQGAPTAVTAFMSAATKIAAFGVMLRLFYVAFPLLHDYWRPALWAVAILTMVVATVAAITQADVKRMLAYSAVSHTGFILTGVVAGNDAGVSATLFYLFAYGFNTVGAFAVVGLVRNSADEEDTAMARWAGLGRRHPVVAVVFSLFLLAFAGIPLTSGFVSKFAVFKAAAEGGAMPLVIVGVIASAVAAYFYVRVIVLMFFTEPPADPPTVAVPSVLSTAVVTVTAAVTFALGALPQPLLDLANHADQLLS